MKTKKQKQDYFRQYYLKKIKPFRKNKGAVGYHSFVCPICKRRSFMRNLKYTQPFSVDYVMFTGDKGIKWFRNKFDPEQKQIIVQLIKLKLIQTMQEFGITAEDLGIEKIEIRRSLPFVEVVNSLTNFNQKSNINQRLETPLRQEV